jgi:hypothetical protein
MKNRETNNDWIKGNKFFAKCCELANTPVTTRQASKFRNKKGSAFKYVNKAVALRG